MNKFIRLLLTFFICLFLANWSFSQSWDWSVQFGNQGNEIINGLENTFSGEYFMAGAYSETLEIGDTTLASIGFADVFLSKLDASGSAIWTVSGGSTNIDETAGISIDTSENIIWTGQFWVQSYFGPDTLFAQSSSKAIFMVKYNSQGNYLWSKSISGSGIKVINDVATDSENNIYLTGYFEDSLFIDDDVLIAPDGQNFFLLKYHETGDLIWGKNYGTFGEIRGNCIDIDSNDDIVVGGYFQGAVDFDGFELESNNIDFDLFVVKFSPSGTAIWAKEALGVYDDICGSITIDSANNIYLSGSFIGEMSLGDGIQIATPGFQENLFLIKYDTDGTPIWARGLDSQEFNDISFGLDIKVHQQAVGMVGFFDGELKVDEFSILSESSQFNGFAASFNTSDGKAKWLQLIPGSSQLISNQIEVNSNGELTFGGYFSENAYFDNNTMISNGLNDVFISKLKDISTSHHELEKEVLDFEIFPNPASDVINILTEADVYFIKIYDLHGRLIKGIENEKTIDVSNLTSGNYFLQTGNDFFVKNVLFTKM